MSTGRPPAPEVASTSTSAPSSAPAGAAQRHRDAGRGLVVRSRRRRRRRPRRAAVGCVPGLALDDGRVGEERRGLRRRRRTSRRTRRTTGAARARGPGRTRRCPRTPSCRRCRARPRSPSGSANSSASPARTRRTTSLTGVCRCDVPRYDRAAGGQSGQRLRRGPSTGRSRSGRRAGWRAAGMTMRARPLHPVHALQVTACRTVRASRGPRTAGAGPGRRSAPTGGSAGRCASARGCARDQPAVRAQVNIDVNMCGGTSAKSSTTAAQNSTLVSQHPVRAAVAQLGERGLLQRLGDLVARARRARAAVRRSTRARGSSAR